MKEVIVFFILFFIAAMLAFFLQNIGKNTVQGTITTGIIKKKFYSDTGNISYDIALWDRDKFVKGETEYYSKVSNVAVEDEVKIKYYYTNKGKIVIEIVEEGFVPCSAATKSATKILWICTGVFLAIAISFLLKK